MDELFDKWCQTERTKDAHKRLIRMTERDGALQSLLSPLARRVRSHYVSNDGMAAYLDALGHSAAAREIRRLYPKSKRSRSSDLGEILGTEVLERHTKYQVPIRKLRYKDHREQPMRGEDIIGVRVSKDEVYFLKGEAKSNIRISQNTIEVARAQLQANAGRPTAYALTFIARRLLETGKRKNRKLAKRILAEIAKEALPKRRIAHFLFVLTGNSATKQLEHDLQVADGERPQYTIQLRADDHPALVQAIYQELNRLALN